ncbi:MAG: alpha/beta fold hydrolase [Thermodesulfobacteriota bacterium]
MKRKSYTHGFFKGLAAFFVIFSCSHGKVEGAEDQRDGGFQECVVLLHGMARTSHSMDDMEEALNSAGYQTVNLDYPSTAKEIAELVEVDLQKAIAACQAKKASRIHFVTHSLGGIIVRKGLKDKRPERLGRVVMLSPPNQGSDVAEKLKGVWFYEWLNGPAGQSLGTGSDSLPNRLGPVDYPVGIITGNQHAFFDSWFASFIPGENDGKVSVEQAKVSGMTDFLVVPEAHPFIMGSEQVIEETIHFLVHGRFSHRSAP